MPDVLLSNFEVFLAASIGVKRHIFGFTAGQRNKIGNENFGWHTDIEGACAEMAFAKHMGVYWDGSMNFKAPDVAGIQVRHTERDNGCLIVRATDADDELFALVTGRAPRFRVRGAIMGREAKAPRFMRRDVVHPAYFVPQEWLQPLLRPAALTDSYSGRDGA